MSAKPITQIIDYLDIDYNPTSENNAHFIITTKFNPDGSIESKSTEIILTPSPSYLDIAESVAIPTDLTNVDIVTPQGSRQNMENYLATGSDLNSQPSMHNEEGWAGSRAIPEEQYRISAPSPIQYIRETVSNLRQEFDWASDDYLLTLKQKVNSLGGKLYLIRAAEETITDHRSEGEPLRRKLDERELFAMARTAINKDIDINHLGQGYITGGVVVDAEYSDAMRKLQMIFWEKDPEVIAAIDQGFITAVSINAGKPRTRAITQCSADGEMCDTPTGLILGELDGIAITYVVTSEGWMWRGKPISAAQPGVATTAIQEF